MCDIILQCPVSTAWFAWSCNSLVVPSCVRRKWKQRIGQRNWKNDSYANRHVIGRSGLDARTYNARGQWLRMQPFLWRAIFITPHACCKFPPGFSKEPLLEAFVGKQFVVVYRFCMQIMPNNICGLLNNASNVLSMSRSCFAYVHITCSLRLDV